LIKEEAILTEILKLVIELHEANIAVGNLQPDYLYLTQDNKLKISNFLIARKLESDETKQIDTFFLNQNSEFIAP